MVINVAALIALMVAPSFPVVLIAALLLGLGTGADLPVSLSTIAEAGTDDNRGKLLGLSNLLWLAGAVVTSLLTPVVAGLGRVGIVIIFGQIAVVALLTLLGRLTVPESDVWLAARRERVEGAATARAARAGVRELFTAQYAAPLVALLVFYGLTNLVANTSGQFGTFVAVTFGHIDLAVAGILGLGLLPLSIVGFLWFMRIADKPVRYRYFVIGSVFFVASPLVLAVAGVNLVTYLVSATFMVIGVSFAFEGIMKVWTAESFPTLLRTTAQGAVIAVARFAAAALAAVTPLLLQVGTGFMYGFLTVTTAIGVVTAAVVFRKRDRHNEFDVEDLPVADASDFSNPIR